MKKLALLFLVLTLSGCAAIGSLQTSKYDTAEYTIVTSLSSIAEVGSTECADPVQMKTTAYSLMMKATEFKNYTADIPNSVESNRISNSLFDIIKGLSDKYNSGEKVSVVYCSNKMAIVERAAKAAKFAIGSKQK